ncbi:MAG TPA: hypothetical protein VFN78_00560 [Ktedonobacterales bacterium]|nr:hypothetical protein [Ktedonobacterales bacterium]
MAKKSQSGRGRQLPPQAKSPARKPQAPERAGTATLVRSPASATPETPSAANIVAEPQPAAPKAQPQPAPAAVKPASAPAAAKAPVKPAATPKAATKPAPSAAAPAAKPNTGSSREQNQRIARARAVQRARQANLISAESYAYVLGDLKLVAALAVSAFVVLIALTFVLPH